MENDAAVTSLVVERERLRRGRRWANADGIRDRLQSAGIVVDDMAAGPRWRRRGSWRCTYVLFTTMGGIEKTDVLVIGDRVTM